MPARAAVAAAVAALAAAAAAPPSLLVAAEPSGGAGSCAFANEPAFPGYFWDPSCKEGQVGCNADGVNLECRFCGGGDYPVPCPPSSCHFPNDPFVPYFWDPTCEMGMLGCWADGIHRQCRFCGDHPFTGIPCPEGLSAAPNGASCTWTENVPTTPYYWDAGCKMGMHGCNADGIHEQCRFCGEGVFADIPCPASEVCSFAAEPQTPYFWDPECANGKLGCLADGIHAQCRFCEKMPFEGIPCPGPIQPPKDQCTFPLHGEPTMGYYWDEECENGKLGCWADGMHAECRFCGGGVFEEIPCPNSTAAPGSSPGAAAPAAAGEALAGKATYDAAKVSRAYMREVSLASVAKDMTGSGGEGEEKLLNGAAAVAPGLGALALTLAGAAASSASRT